MNTTDALLCARAITVTYQRRSLLPLGARQRPVQALRGVDLDIHVGETLALVGESGSGKSTLARVLVRTITPSSGTIAFRGSDITSIAGRPLRSLRRHFQMVFQDPFSSLNPRLSVGSAIGEPLIVHRLAKGAALRARVGECLAMVGLDASATMKSG